MKDRASWFYRFLAPFIFCDRNTFKCEHGLFPLRRLLGFRLWWLLLLGFHALPFINRGDPAGYSVPVFSCVQRIASLFVVFPSCDVVVIGRCVCCDISCVIGFLIRLMRTILYPEVETPWRYMFNELLWRVIFWVLWDGVSVSSQSSIHRRGFITPVAILCTHS